MIASEQLALLTARAGIGRAGCMRAGCALPAYLLEPDGSGKLLWKRPAASDGNPDDTVSAWTNVRE